MSKSRWGVLGTGAVLLLAASVSSAQPATEVSDMVAPRASLAGETYIGPHIGMTFFGHKDVYCRCDVDQNDFLFLGGRFGHFFTDNLAIEATGQFTRPDRVPSYWEFTAGAMWDFTPRVPGWNTYVAAGGGASRPVPYFRGKGVPIAYLAFGSEYRFNKVVGMRLEMKGQYNFRTTLSDQFGPFEQAGRMDLQPNIGVLFHFGGNAQPAIVTPAPAPVAPPPPAPPAAAVTPEPAPAPIATPPPAPESIARTPSPEPRGSVEEPLFLSRLLLSPRGRKARPVSTNPSAPLPPRAPGERAGGEGRHKKPDNC
ncbi:MAG: hypothetical protein LC780_16250 [Acidobacteria bacterium]|nr:hypothetical protein [Acidobacteriota bacterium]